MQGLLSQTIEVAKSIRAVNLKDLGCVIIDSTMQD
jgi:hypothetical protein